MKRKIMISVILLILCAVTICLLPFSREKKIKYELKKANNNIAVMVYDDEKEDYVKQDTIPTGDYEINTELSHCDANGQILSYDSTLGSVSVKMDSADQCYLYFDSHVQVALIPKPLSSNNASDGGVASAYIGGSSGTATSGTGTTHAPYLYYAFDNNLSTAYDDYYGSGGNVANSQITYQFPKKAVVNKISIANDNSGFDRYLYSVKIQRSDDGTNWTDVHTITGMETNLSKQEYEYEFNNTVAARYWRVRPITTTNSNKWQIQELQFYGYYPTFKADQDTLVYQMAQKTFNGSSDYINTGIKLFNSDNLHKDFLISFDITSGTYASSSNTLMNMFNEAATNSVYAGCVFRYDSGNSSKYNLRCDSSTSNTNKYTSIDISGTNHVEFKRESDKFYYSINNGPFIQLINFSDFAYPHNVPLTFGASLNGSGNPYRYFTGTLSNIKVYVEDYDPDLKFHMDSKTFNGSSDYINTGVYLFNSENVNKDFLVSFNISSGTYASSYNTLFNTFDEAKANGYYYGVIFRYHNSNSSNYQIVSYVNDTTSASANVAISGTTNVRIKRESKVISYSINNGSWTTLQSFASTNATVNTPATFGSSWNGSGPYRYFTGTLTDMNIYVYD